MNLYEWMPRLLNMSLTAGIVILFVLTARVLLRGAPRRYLSLLWLVPLVRLLCPWSLSAPFSLLSMLSTPVVGHQLEYIPPTIVHDAVPRVSLPVQAVSNAVNAALPQETEQLAADPLEIYASFGALFWLTGAILLLGWGVFALLRLRLRLKDAVRVEPGVWRADVPTAFVWSCFRPEIYLPFGLTEQEEALVLRHERAHIARRDPVLRLLQYLALCLHWFNPLVWVIFVLSGRDMELACDEHVLEHAQEDIRAEYAETLLRQAAGVRALPLSPLSFGAGDVKKRIESILRFEGGRTRLTAFALLAVLTLGLCLLVNPVGEPVWNGDGQTYQAIGATYLPPDTELKMTELFETAISEESELFIRSDDDWKYAGTFEEIDFTEDELRAAFLGDAADPGRWDGADEESFLDGITRVRQCRSEADMPINWQNWSDDGEEASGTDYVTAQMVYTLFEQADGSRHLAVSCLSSWKELKALHAGKLGQDITEWYEEPASGWIGDARFPAFFYMLRLSPLGTYAMETAPGDGRLAPKLNLHPGGRFALSSDPLSSYLAVGTYTVGNGRLTARTDDGLYVYVFEFADDGSLRFVQAESDTVINLGADFAAPVEDGSIFFLNE